MCKCRSTLCAQHLNPEPATDDESLMSAHLMAIDEKRQLKYIRIKAKTRGKTFHLSPETPTAGYSC